MKAIIEDGELVLPGSVTVKELRTILDTLSDTVELSVSTNKDKVYEEGYDAGHAEAFFTEISLGAKEVNLMYLPRRYATDIHPMYEVNEFKGFKLIPIGEATKETKQRELYSINNSLNYLLKNYPESNRIESLRNRIKTLEKSQ